MNHKCPYCGSEKITLDANVLITGVLHPDGTITVNDYWTPQTLAEESIAGLDSSDIRGFCHNCGMFAKFSWEKGYVVYPMFKERESVAEEGQGTI